MSKAKNSKATNSKATNSRTKRYYTVYIQRCNDGHYNSMFTMLEDDYDLLNDLHHHINNSPYADGITDKNPFAHCEIGIDEYQPYVCGDILGEFNLKPHHFKNFINYPEALERCIENLDGYGDLFKLQLYKCSMERFTVYQFKEYQNKMRILCNLA